MIISSPFPFFGITSFILLLSALVPQVEAHGYIASVTPAGGQTYEGWNPFTDPYASPKPQRAIRNVPSDGPITNINDPNLACNTGGETGSPVVIDVDAGSNFSMKWSYWYSDHLGPTSVSMTSCNGDCTQFNVGDADWFKIDAMGMENGQWASQMLISDNVVWTTQIPSKIKPGQYLIRHEMIALHSNPPQYYPGCIQVNVKGSGSSTPSSSELFKVPGVYNNVDYPDVWTTTIKEWAAPGPPVVSFADIVRASSGSSSGSSGSDSGSDGSSSNDQGGSLSSSPSYSVPSSIPSSNTPASNLTSMSSPHGTGSSGGATGTAKGSSPSAAPTSVRASSDSGKCRLVHQNPGSASGRLKRRHSLFRRRSF